MLKTNEHLFIFADACTDEVGFPAIPLPYTNITSIHLLPAMSFSCSGYLYEISLNADTPGDLKFGVALWLQYRHIAQIKYIFSVIVTQVGSQTISLEDDQLYMESSWFLVLIANKENVSPLMYMTQYDIAATENDLQLVYEATKDILVNTGDILQLNDTDWKFDRTMISLSARMMPTKKKNTTDYGKYHKRVCIFIHT